MTNQSVHINFKTIEPLWGVLQGAWVKTVWPDNQSCKSFLTDRNFYSEEEMKNALAALEEKGIIAGYQMTPFDQTRSVILSIKDLNTLCNILTHLKVNDSRPTSKISNNSDSALRVFPSARIA